MMAEPDTLTDLIDENARLRLALGEPMGVTYHTQITPKLNMLLRRQLRTK